MLTFDHIAIAGRTLDEATAYVSETLGVPLDPGGKHAAFGTHNRLLSLGDLYLEVIALDPDAQRSGPSWFGLDRFDGPPRPANWICRTDDLDSAILAAPVEPGPVRDLTRGALEWQITVPEDGSLPLGGAYPTLIRWGEGMVHPTVNLTPRGCRLIRWEVHHPDADLLRAQVRIDDPRVSFETGAPGFVAVIDTPSGERRLE